MDDLDVLARDFGYRPQGKSAPMRSEAADRSSSTTVRSSSSSSPFIDDRDGLLFNDVFGGPPKYSHTSATTNSNKSSSANDFDYGSIFKSSSTSNNHNKNNDDNYSYSNTNSSKTSSMPVYDKPVYDDDIFEGLPGLKSKSVSSSTDMRFEENIFASMAASPPKRNFSSSNDQFGDLLGNLGKNERGHPERKDVRSSSVSGLDDLLGNLGRNEKAPEGKSSSSKSSSSRGGGGGFDDLLGAFGSGGSASGNRSSPGPAKSNQTNSSMMDDPFVVLESTSTRPSSSSGVFTDPLEEIGKAGKSGSTKAGTSSDGAFDDLDPLNGFGKSIPPVSPERVGREDGSPSRSGPSISGMQSSTVGEQAEKSSSGYADIHSQKVPVDNFQESPLFDMPSVSTDSKRSSDQNASSPPFGSARSKENNFRAEMSPRSEEQAKSMDDIWLTVSEIPLFTQPTKAPPPSRPPPPIPRRTSKAESSFFSSNARKKDDEFSPSYSSFSESPKPGLAEGKSPPTASQIDELEDFVMGRTQNSVDENANVNSSEEMDAAAAAMKEAMDRAEAKFRHAKEVREREYAKAARSKETVHMEEDEQVMQDTSERDFRENHERLERERQQREKEEEEREQRRLERERARQAEIERGRARQAVERANREARERAAAEARERAAAEARLRAERALVEKAQAEARERAARMAVQRAQAEARERAAAEARDRAQKAAAEARERANTEAREKEAKEKAEARRRAERAAVEKAAAEARERAAGEARERAAAARMNQQKNEDDLESFFSSRASSAPKTRTTSSDPFFDTQFQSKGGPDGASRTSFTSMASSNIRKASSATNIVDDLSSIFGAPPSSGEFQEVEGESEERRRARLERHQRTQERAAKALAEKNQRDLQAQKEQEERHRIAETLDFEIKRWAAGKEGNLRALLSTLQYVLWPECGWQPVSLTDLITGVSVKKVYRKATLCIHPDKVQQKGATLQQKYIAEKVFDLLKEAWNKFNSEELF